VLDAADMGELKPGQSAERDEAIGAVGAGSRVAGLPEEAILAEADLAAESRA
jgi:hypothetical protein